MAAALVVAIAVPASADWYESDKEERSGMIIGIAVGGAVVKGLGKLKDIGGLGAGASLRIGTVATPNLLWLLTIENANYLIEDEMKDVKVNQSWALTLGGQYYVRDALWLRLGIGPGGFIRRADQRGATPESSFSGFGWTSGIGVDVWFRRSWVINFEAVFTGTVVGGGFISHGGLMLALTRY